MAARTMWKGSIAFGMVMIPVKVSKATEDHDLHFHILHEPDNGRIAQTRTCSVCGTAVSAEDSIRAYEDENGVMVPLSRNDFEGAKPESSRSITIETFVPLSQVDPIFFEETYYVEPADGVGRKPFALLRAALEKSKRVGIARVTMSGREHLCAVRVFHNTLALQTLRYSDEVRSASEGLEGIRLTRAETELAGALISSLAGDFTPEKYHDSYREALVGVITAKQSAAALPVQKVKSPKAQSQVVDLMAALRASVEQPKKRPVKVG